MRASLLVSLSVLLTSLTLLPSSVAAQAATDAALLRGSKAALAAENRAADRHKLRRYAHSEEVRADIKRGELVLLADASGYYADESVGEFGVVERELYLHVRPWTKTFLDDLSMDLNMHLTKVGADVELLKLTSLVRTVAYQELIKLRYANAAPGDTAETRSSHLTGATVDISTKDLSPRALRWLRHRIAKLERRGFILATEERGRGGTAKRPSSTCFHVMVLPNYKRP